jgi:hypothetical protein
MNADRRCERQRKDSPFHFLNLRESVLICGQIQGIPNVNLFPFTRLGIRRFRWYSSTSLRMLLLDQPARSRRSCRRAICAIFSAVLRLIVSSSGPLIARSDFSLGKQLANDARDIPISGSKCQYKALPTALLNIVLVFCVCYGAPF